MNNSKEERVAVYIDGSNFYNYLKNEKINFFGNARFNFSAFVDYLVGDRKCVSKRYYTGVFRNINKTEKAGELRKGQQRFFLNLEEEGFIIKKGRIMSADGEYKEKGTDVKIAVDLVVGAVDDQYDTAILVSSDTDLVPAIRYIRYKKKKLEYVGFAYAPSLGMKKYADSFRLLTLDDVKRFEEEENSSSENQKSKTKQ